MTKSREWLKEAYEIAQGTRASRGIKREHIVAVLNQLGAVDQMMKTFEAKLGALYKKERDRRASEGLPPPPVPPTFQRAAK